MRITPEKAIRNVLFLCVLLPLLLSSCAAPTLAQQQDSWRVYRDSVRATCVVGSAKDPAMPTEVKLWCNGVVDP